MNNKSFKRKFTLVLFIYTILILCVWFLYHSVVFSYTHKNIMENLKLESGRLVSIISDELINMKTAASVIGGSVSVKDFLSEQTITAYYEKAAAVSEIIAKATSSATPFDNIITIDTAGNFYRFVGELSNRSIGYIYDTFGKDGGVFTSLRLDDNNYFCHISPVLNTSDNKAVRIGGVIIANSLVRTRRALVKNKVSDIDTAVISDGIILVATNEGLEGLPFSELEKRYNLISSTAIEGTTLSVVATVTKDTLSLPRRLFGLAAGVIVVLLGIIILILYHYLSKVMINPLLSTKEKMQLGLLGNQIDAHFMVNTLKTIELLLQRNETEHAETVSHGLSELLKHQHRGVCNIFDELSVLERYIEIMNIRFRNRYSVHYTIDDALMEYTMQCFVLQPIVENAFMHGFTEGRTDFMLTITGRLVHNTIVLEVRDNGAGMSASTLAAVQARLGAAQQNELPTDGLHGVALLNIQKRIQALHGKHYGVWVESTPQNGTTVTVRFPAEKDNTPHYDNPGR